MSNDANRMNAYAGQATSTIFESYFSSFSPESLSLAYFYFVPRIVWMFPPKSAEENLKRRVFCPPSISGTDLRHSGGKVLWAASEWCVFRYFDASCSGPPNRVVKSLAVLLGAILQNNDKRTNMKYYLSSNSWIRAHQFSLASFFLLSSDKSFRLRGTCDTVQPKSFLFFPSPSRDR